MMNNFYDKINVKTIHFETLTLITTVLIRPCFVHELIMLYNFLCAFDLKIALCILQHLLNLFNS